MTADLATTLDALDKYGDPMLYKSDRGGWRCTVSMRVNSTGVTFDVKGTGQTSLQAATDCQDNMAAAIKNINSVAEPGRALLQGGAK